MRTIDEFKENPALAKLDILANGISIKNDLGLKENESKEKYVYDSAVTTSITLPSEVILPQDIVTNVLLCNTSPWSLEKRALYYEGKKVFDIKITPEANFTNRILPDGTPANKVAVMYGKDVFSVFLNKICAYFACGKGCQFCSIDYTRKTKRGSASPSIPQVAEVFKLALTLDRGLFNHVLVTSGAYGNPDKGIEKQIAYIDAMKPADNATKKYHLTTIPPVSNELLYKLKACITTLSFDIEVFDPDLFRLYCPGKEAQIGYENFLRIFEDSSNIFQKNILKAGFVCGLESIDTLVEGMEFFGKLGIPPALNIFHPDEGTPLATRPRPSKEYIEEAVKEQARIYKKWGLIPVFPEYGRRSSLDTEVFRGFFGK